MCWANIRALSTTAMGLQLIQLTFLFVFVFLETVTQYHFVNDIKGQTPEVAIGTPPTHIYLALTCVFQ